MRDLDFEPGEKAVGFIAAERLGLSEFGPVREDIRVGDDEVARGMAPSKCRSKRVEAQATG